MLALFYVLLGAGIPQSVQRLATGWTAEEVRVRVSVGGNIFLLSTPLRPVLGPAQPPTQWEPVFFARR
jgi:hypothetical protein